jgi:hypothetical protein
MVARPIYGPNEVTMSIESVIHKIAVDPEFKRAMEEDPTAALKSHGIDLPLDELKALKVAMRDSELSAVLPNDPTDWYAPQFKGVVRDPTDWYAPQFKEVSRDPTDWYAPQFDPDVA